MSKWIDQNLMRNEDHLEVNLPGIAIDRFRFSGSLARALRGGVFRGGVGGVSRRNELERDGLDFGTFGGF